MFRFSSFCTPSVEIKFDSLTRRKHCFHKLSFFFALLVVQRAHSHCDQLLLFFLPYKNDAMDDNSNNNIVIRYSLLGYLASEATDNISSG